jgi:hypothetical protein
MMATIAEKAAEARQHMDKQNPTVAPGKTEAERRRIPLSVPQRKLEVPDIPGYHLRWFRGTPQRLAQAERAGFVHVTEDEIGLNPVSLGGDATKAGNSDMGSNVSVIEGSEVDGSGQAVRMYLMKQKMEYKLEDDAIIQKRNDSVVDALTGQYAQGAVGGQQPGESAEDFSTRYVDKKRARIPELFRRKSARPRG